MGTTTNPKYHNQLSEEDEYEVVNCVNDVCSTIVKTGLDDEIIEMVSILLTLINSLKPITEATASRTLLMLDLCQCAINDNTPVDFIQLVAESKIELMTKYVIMINISSEEMKDLVMRKLNPATVGTFDDFLNND